MKKGFLSSKAACWLFCLASLLGLQSASMAQCTLTIPSYPGNTASITIDAYPAGVVALFQDTVNPGPNTGANSPVPAGTYLGWCIDILDQIDVNPSNPLILDSPLTYNVLMYSTCDLANLDEDLIKAGYPATETVTSATAADWNAVNYILNHKLAGASYWDIQCAIWNFVGGPLSDLANPSTYPTPNMANVNAMVNAANANPKWQPSGTNVIAVVLAVPPGNGNPTGLTQVTIIEVPLPPQPQVVCCPPPQQKCGGWGGSVWCNAQLSCNPGKPCKISCQNATVTFNCGSGHSYTYNVPNCQVNFSSKCYYSSCSYQNGQWCTTVPCSGDSQIFLTGCGIPWQNDFNNCTSICWTGTFNCSTPGVSCQWQTGACSYNCDLSNCNTVQVKPCYQNNGGYNNNDCAGTPENYKSYCSGGNNNWNNNGWNNGWNNNNNNNSWNNSYCGNWSNPGSFKW